MNALIIIVSFLVGMFFMYFILHKMHALRYNQRFINEQFEQHEKRMKKFRRSFD